MVGLHVWHGKFLELPWEEREAALPLQPSPRKQLLWAFHSTELLQFLAARTVCSLLWKKEERFCAREF